MSLIADNPLGETGPDALARAPLAASFARRILALDSSEGLVVGVLGPWGSGKTTFLNYARPELGKGSEALLDFNPWMFSGAEQLVESFFVELSAELRLRPDLAAIGDDLASYGEAFAGLGWLPVVGPWIERGRGAAKVLSRYLSRRREGSAGRRRELSAELAKLERPIVVVLDDIDRLSSREIRETFKLIRLTASFPNVVYVAAFDRHRVEQALSEEGVPGRDYLEKILQVAVDLPVAPAAVLTSQVTAALDDAIAGAEVRALDQEVWADVLIEVIRPLISNMRDVRRYGAAVFTTIDAIGEEIALADLLALEALRTFAPDIFAWIQISVDALCTPGPPIGGARDDPPELKEEIEAMLEVARASGEERVAKATIRRLFPFACRHIENNNFGPDWEGTFLRERRVAHREVLSHYLERVAGAGLVGAGDAEAAWARMEEAEALEKLLLEIPAERREDAISSLEAYEDEFRPAHVVPAATVLLNLIDGLPERRRGMIDLGPGIVVGRVVVRLLRCLGDQEAAAAAAEEIFDGLRSLSAKHELLRILGTDEGSERTLLSEEAKDRLRHRFSEEVSAAAPQELATERELARVIYRARHAAADADPIAVPDDPAVSLALLQSTRSEQLSQNLESNAVRRTPVLAWSALTDLYGSEATLLARIEELKASEIELPEDLEELVDKYLAGWRPS